MGQLYIVHGAFGSPDENWFPWLANEIRSRGHDVTVPRFPTPEGQSLDSWLAVIEPHVLQMGRSTVLVGHSLGAVFLAHLLALRDVHVRACVFVAGFGSRLGNAEFDDVNATFVDTPLDAALAKSRCDCFVAYVSNEDPYVPVSKAISFASLLGAELVRVPGAGHFNRAAGYTEFPAVRDRCLRFLRS